MNTNTQVISIVKVNENLTDGNLFLFASKHYDNPGCVDMEEFYSDLLIATNIKKLFSKYRQGSMLKTRLLINHFISFFNVFENEAAAKILFFKIDEKYWSYLKTILVFLDRCPNFILIEGKFINISNINLDLTLLKLLEHDI